MSEQTIIIIVASALLLALGLSIIFDDDKYSS